MYQYKAILTHNKKIIAEGHTLEDIEQNIVTFKRKQKHGEHTDMNNNITIIHNLRDKVSGKYKEKIIKIV